MANIQHKNVTDPNIHESKGAATAAIDTVRVSDGAGSGTWKKVDSKGLKNLLGDGGIADKRILTDGTDGFKLVTDVAVGSMVITANVTGFAITAAADPTLMTTTDYALLTGVGAPWVSDHLHEVTFSVNRLTAPVTGVYKIDLWSNISGYPTNTAKLGVKYRVNGGVFSSRTPMTKSTAAGDTGSLNGFGLLDLNAGDYIQLYVASTATGSIVIDNANATLSLVKQTA